MAAGSRNSAGKWADIVFHYTKDPLRGTPICGTKNYGVVTDGSPAYGPVTCQKCLKKLAKK